MFNARKGFHFHPLIEVLWLDQMTDETQIQDLKRSLKSPMPLFFYFTLLDVSGYQPQDPGQTLTQSLLPPQIAPAL